MANSPPSGATAALPAVSRWGPSVVALLLTLALGWFLGQPGYTTTRLAFFAVIAGVAWAGAAGALLDRSGVVLASSVGLFLLGFWQAVLWIVVLPAAVLTFAAALALSGERPAGPVPGPWGE